MRRRQALLGGAAAAGFWPAPDRAMRGRLLGPSAAIGHRLRDGGLPEPSSFSRTDVAIVGGGIAGLSAVWWLRRRGIADIALIELEPQPGGNAAHGRNAVSAYPWGAHYVPLLTAEAEHARILFEEIGLITGHTASGEPIYDELALCADPHERLFILGRWQEDLLPALGVTEADRAQYASFFAAMNRFRAAIGNDGRRAFAIPVDRSSADPQFLELDRLSMADWMAARGWDSPPLLWYIDYCCRDDFGAHAAETSAWAGIHYFAARGSRGQEDQAVLTWPQGNGFLAEQLARLAGPCATSALAWRVQPDGAGVALDIFDPATASSRRLAARAVILATPRFVADRLLGRVTDPARSYAPWMVANVTLGRMPGGGGARLAWDNVVYGSPSLGYVVATHQGLELMPRETVLTYYWPLCDASPDEARRQAFATSLADWQRLVLAELLRIHPELEGAVRSVDVWVWGHGMVRPTPGSMWGSARRAACQQTPPVFFAHSDMSGISLFEEANARGVAAADAVAAYLRA
jgi:hypothetical protein